MENPNTWTALHHKVSAAYPDIPAIVAVFEKHGHPTTEEEVSNIAEAWENDRALGKSIVSTLVEKIRDKPE